jgi:hypothetical protein
MESNISEAASVDKKNERTIVNNTGISHAYSKKVLLLSLNELQKAGLNNVLPLRSILSGPYLASP